MIFGDFGLYLRYSGRVYYYVGSNKKDNTMKSKLTLILSILHLLSVNVWGRNINDLNGYSLIYLSYQSNSIVSAVELRFKEIGFKVYRDANRLKSVIDFKDDPLRTLQCQINHD